MTTSTTESAGAALVAELGLAVARREGHNLRCGCPACGSSDNLNVHVVEGKFQCFSCDVKGNCFDLCKLVLPNDAAAMEILTRLGLRESNANTNGRAVADPLAVIAKQKGVRPAWLEAYGARRNGRGIVIPGYDPTGNQCSEFTLLANGTKGKWAAKKPAGVFLPCDESGVRLPKPGETWLVVEGPKDAAALHGLKHLAIGINGTKLAAKFARLLRDCHAIVVPDRDVPSTEGAKKTAGVLFGVAASIRVATLPGELTASKGIDVRDVLRRDGGAELVKQAVADARVVEPPDGAAPSIKATGGADRFRLTDVGNAARLVARHGATFRYVEPWRKWMAWDQQRWEML